MKLLDKILFQRLDKIRSDLDSYIEKQIDVMLIPSFAAIPLADEDTDIDFEQEEYCDEEVNETDEHDTEEIRIYSPPKCMSPVAPSAPSIPSYSSGPREASIPSFRGAESKLASIDEFLENKAETFSSMLLRLIDEKGLKDSEVYKKANIDRRLFSKIRGDEDYVPSKKTAISFCLALQLDVDEAKKLIEAAGYTLSKSSRFDLIIMYLIENREYNIHFANIVLEDYGEGTLSK